MLTKFIASPKCTLGASIMLGVTCLGLAALVLSPAPALAQSCKATDKDTTIAAPELKDQVEYYCFTAFSKCANGTEKQDQIVSCKTEQEARIASNRQPPEVTGVCTQKTLNDQDHFYKALAPFKAIRENLDIAIAGLHATTGTLPVDSFGPKDNKKVQELNRDSAREQLLDMQTQFKAKVGLYSSLSNPDCFECAVLEKWAVLKGARNLINESYTFDTASGAEIGVQVGANDPRKLVATKDSESETGAIGSKTKREIARPQTGIYKGEVDLEEVTDQWASGLDPALIQDLKKEICNLADAKDFNKIYRNGDLYFPYAQRVQRLINKAFLKNSANGFKSPFDKAREAEAGVAGRSAAVKLTDLYAKYGPKGTDKDKKCGPSELEMVAFDPEYYRKPSFCK